MATHTSPASAALVAAIRPYQSFAPLVDGIAAALGFSDYAEMGSAGDIGVSAFWVDPAEEVFTCWMRTRNQIVLHQRSKANQSFTLNVPIDRLRRISEELTPEGVRRVTIEIDADRDVLEMISVANEDGSRRSSGAILPASYTLVAEADRSADLDRFARDLRRSLL